MTEPLEPCTAKDFCRATKGLPASTMKEEYLPPLICYKAEPKEIYARRDKFRREVIEDVTEELEAEMRALKDLREYCTTYDDLFQIPGFELKSDVPGDIITNPEMHLKHPLYKSKPVTIWTQRIDAATTDAARITGLTKMRDPLDPFKKWTAFSKPIYEKLDDNEC